MEATLEYTLSIDKTDWSLVRFGDVVQERRESTKDPIADGVKHVVGLEHIDPEDIHLRRSSNFDGSTTFSKKFSKGDVLFGRRRAYLKKAVLADFEGICSGDITVLCAKECLIPELLPFVVNNDKFFDYAVKHSAGGLSPRVKFKDLANYQFLLPPKDQQSKIAELLLAMDEVIEKDTALLDTLKDLYSTNINQFMIHGIYRNNGEIIKSECGLLDSRIETMELKDCLVEKPTYGANASSKPYVNGAPRYIRITDIDDEGNLIEEDKVTIDSTDYSPYILRDQDFLIARTGNTVGKTFLYNSGMEESVFAGYLIRFRLNTNMLRPRFLFYYSKSLKFEAFKSKMIKVGAQPNINSEEYQSIVLPQFSVDVQDQLISKLDFINSSLNGSKSKIIKSRALQKTLINQIF